MMSLAISGNILSFSSMTIYFIKNGLNIFWSMILNLLFFRSKLVCEDSDDLLARAGRENPGVTIPEPVAIKN